MHLNETGKVQAENCGKALKDVVFDAMYSSDLTRARQTCDIILQVESFDSSLVFI